MAAKYTSRQDTTIGDRLLNVGAAAVQLSTGDAVMLVYDPIASAGDTKITLFLVTASSGHTNANTAIGFIDDRRFAYSGFPQSLALCRDASDNIYVVGRDATQAGQVGVQAFKKQSGLHWTQQAYLTASYSGFSLNAGTASNFSGFAACWCGTGGGSSGAGHLMVLANEGALGRNWAFTINAGAALAGKSSLGILGAALQPPNPAFMGLNGGAIVTDGSNLDLEPDGFGATYGMAVTGNDATHCTVGTWGVTSQGVITSGFGMAADQRVCGTLTHTATKLRILRVSSGLWAVVGPSSTHAGQLTVWAYTSSGLQGSVDSGTASNFPSPSATLNWGAAIDAGGVLWLYGWSTAAATTMLRLPVTFDSSNAPSLGVGVTDDTAVGTGTNTTIRVVKQPVDPLHTDWQTYNTTSPYALLGDFSALTSPPLPATLGPPAAGAVASLSTGGTVAWTFNPRNSGDTQSGYYLRRAQPSSATEYWNPGTGLWQSSEVLNSTSTQSVTFISGKWTADTTYSWSVDTVGATGLRAGYATDQNVLVATSPVPSTPSLTATYDSVNNRVTLVIGGTGTLSATVQYSGDGGASWATLRATPVTLAAGAATVYDYEAPPGQTRQYRAFQQDATDLYGAASANSTVQSATPAITTFWLRDPTALSAGITPHIRRGTFNTSIGEAVAIHRPLGRMTAVVISDSTLQGEYGSATFWTNSTADETNLLGLLNAQRTLLLQSPDNRAWYIRITSARPTSPVSLVRPGTAREHAVSWVQVQSPA